jgi:hypothetical protein
MGMLNGIAFAKRFLLDYVHVQQMINNSLPCLPISNTLLNGHMAQKRPQPKILC